MTSCPPTRAHLTAAMAVSWAAVRVTALEPTEMVMGSNTAAARAASSSSGSSEGRISVVCAGAWCRLGASSRPQPLYLESPELLFHFRE